MAITTKVLSMVAYIPEEKLKKGSTRNFIHLKIVAWRERHRRLVVIWDNVEEIHINVYSIVFAARLRILLQKRIFYSFQCIEYASQTEQKHFNHIQVICENTPWILQNTEELCIWNIISYFISSINFNLFIPDMTFF